MKTLVLQSAPKEKLFCVALIRTGSDLARRWHANLPAYCIYDFDLCGGFGQIRFGDGSWQDITSKTIGDLILLPELNEDQMDQLGLFV